MINEFSGKYVFLRNDYPCNVEFEGEVYPSGEHAFQASKTKDLLLREKIRTSSLSEALKIGRKEVDLSAYPEWTKKRYDIMLRIQESKFLTLPMKVKLLLTEDHELVQGNMSRDTYWGLNKDGDGENRMGEILMGIRANILTNEGDIYTLISKELSKMGLQDLMKISSSPFLGGLPLTLDFILPHNDNE